MSDHASIRESYEAEVSRPGKFEGESPWVPYFWDRLDEADTDENGVAGWTVTEEDEAIFPELNVDEEVWLRETDSGFVIEVDPPTDEDEEDSPTCEECGEDMGTDCYGNPNCALCNPCKCGCQDA